MLGIQQKQQCSMSRDKEERKKKKGTTEKLPDPQQCHALPPCAHFLRQKKRLGAALQHFEGWPGSPVWQKEGES